MVSAAGVPKLTPAATPARIGVVFCRMDVFLLCLLVAFLVYKVNTADPDAAANRRRARRGPRCVAIAASTGTRCKAFPVDGDEKCRAHGGVPLTTEEVLAEIHAYMEENTFEARTARMRRDYDAQLRRNNVRRHNQLQQETDAVRRRVNEGRTDNNKVPMKPLRDYGSRNDREAVRKQFPTDAGRRAFDEAYPKDEPFRP